MDTGKIIFAACVLLCAVFFAGIGLYAGKRKTPMHFWSGSEVPAWQIRDIPAYNWENRTMWLLYSVPYWLAGVLCFWSMLAAGVLMVLACTAGIAWLVWRYHRIETKYRR